MKQWRITTEYQQQRVDQFLASHTDFSRSQLAAMIKAGFVIRNQQPTKANVRLKAGDILELHEGYHKQTRLKSIAMPLDIIHEDDALLIVNKPRGLVVHPGKGRHEPTLMNGLLHYFKTHEIPGVPGLVHRIDKDTTGLIAIAKDESTHHTLAQQLENKTMNRRYYALIHGLLEEDTAVTLPIGTDPYNKRKQAVSGLHARDAHTAFTVVQHLAGYTLADCQLMSGRTHQIRVHAQAIGHPLVGDPLYRSKTDPDISGQYLCAYRFSFIHPRSKERVSYHIAIPDFFKQKMSELSL